MLSISHSACVTTNPSPILIKNSSGINRLASKKVNLLNSRIKKTNFGCKTHKSYFFKSNFRHGSRKNGFVRSVMESPSKEKPTPSIITGEPFLDYYCSTRRGSDSTKATDQWKILPDIWKSLAEKYPDSLALHDPHHSLAAQITFKQLEEFIQDFAEGLRVLGISERECISLFSDNSHRWIISDQGIMRAGAMNAVRGASKAPADELVHIIKDSNSSAIVLENSELLSKLSPAITKSEECCSSVKFCVLLWGTGGVNSKANVKSVDDSNMEKQNAFDFKLPFPVYSFEEILGVGHTTRRAEPFTDDNSLSEPTRRSTINGDDVATIVYTSGTTGYPKGVMLTHSNLLHQVYALESVLSLLPGERFLSLLPPWHMYERSAEYFALSHATSLVYSSVKTFKEDLSNYPPEYFIAVPLVFEILYNGVQNKLSKSPPSRKKVAEFLMSVTRAYMEAKRVFSGLLLANHLANKPEHFFSRIRRLLCGIQALLLLPLHLLAVKLVYTKIKAALGIKKIAVSGGGSLPAHVDKFFETIGIVLLNGYGLTETSPVLTARLPTCNVLGSVGPPVPGTEIRIVDPETGKILPSGSKGIVKAKGPQIMKGYYKNPSATSSVIDQDGFFDTGDIGWLSHVNGKPFLSSSPSPHSSTHLVLEGRAKDTIVLANGENVEPAAIEEALLRSDKIHQVMIVGQDQRRLGALILPNKEEFINANSAEIKNKIRDEITKEMDKSGFLYSFQRIGNFHVLDQPFSIENGLLTATMKMKREVISQIYKAEIEGLFKH